MEELKMEEEVEETVTVKRRIWDNYIDVGGTMKDDSTKIIVSIACKYGVKYILLRDYYYSRNLDKWMPTKQGIAIPLRRPVSKGEKIAEPFPNVLNLIVEALKQAETMPLEDENNKVHILKKVTKVRKKYVKD